MLLVKKPRDDCGREFVLELRRHNHVELVRLRRISEIEGNDEVMLADKCTLLQDPLSSFTLEFVSAIPRVRGVMTSFITRFPSGVGSASTGMRLPVLSW